MRRQHTVGHAVQAGEITAVDRLGLEIGRGALKEKIVLLKAWSDDTATWNTINSAFAEAGLSTPLVRTRPIVNWG